LTKLKIDANIQSHFDIRHIDISTFNPGGLEECQKHWFVWKTRIWQLPDGKAVTVGTDFAKADSVAERRNLFITGGKVREDMNMKSRPDQKDEAVIPAEFVAPQTSGGIQI